MSSLPAITNPNQTVGNRYRINCKHALFTYAHTEAYSEDKEEVKERWLEILAACNPEPTVSLCVEDYPTSDGTHVHALLSWERRAHRYVDSFIVEEIYPDYRRVTPGKASIQRILEYLSKGSGTVEEPVDFVGELNHVLEPAKPSYARVVTCTTRRDAEEYILGNFPQDFVRNYNNTQAFLNGHFKPRAPEYTTPANSRPFVLTDDISRWIEEESVKVIIFYVQHFSPAS